MMKSALRSFLFVTVFILLGLTVTGIYLKKQALSTPISPLSSPFFKDQSEKKFAIFKTSPPPPGSDAFLESQSRDRFSAVDKLNAKAIVWVDVQVSKDQTLVARRVKEIKMPENIPGPRVLWIRHLTLAEIQKFAPDTPTLVELLKKYSTRRWVINIVDYPPEADLAIVKAVRSADAGDRVIIQSEQDRTLSDIRKVEALWLYGSSLAQITQFVWLKTLSLEAVAPLHADVYITPLIGGQRELFDAKVAREIHRRGIKVFVGPITTEIQAHEVNSLGGDGLISSDPSLLESFLISP